MTTSVPPPPDTIGPYRVLRPIARGGMAEVFEVEDPASGERFALKLLASQGTALPRFNREYEALTRLNHPNIVRVYQFGIHMGQPWMAMELLNGTGLQGRVKNMGKPGEKARTTEVCRVVWHVADALQYIHDRGLVHRDLKSDNVVVLPDGRVKLLDFGTAHVQDAIEPITKEGEFVGTFAYASPEQLTGAPVDHRADLYSLGVLLYRLCTGKPLFESSDPLELARLHAKTPPRPPRELVPELPKALEDAILWCLQKRPDKRPAQAGLIARTLEELAGSAIEKSVIDVAVSPEQAVGREAELQAVMTWLEQAPAGGALLVEGGEGSGRVRFARSVANEADARGWLVLQCAIKEERPLADVLDLLDRIAEPLHQGRRVEGRAAADALRRQVSQGGLEGRKREAVRKAAGLVLAERARVEQREVLVVLQHLHAAGPVALEIVSALRREVALAGLPVRFLASVREVGEDPEADVLLRQRLPDAHHVHLEPLTVRGVALTVAMMLHRRPPPAELARLIHVASGGQPAYVEEVVRQLVTSRALEVRGLDGNRIEWASRDQGVPIAPSARQAVDKTVRRLPAPQRRVLEALSILGDDSVPAAVIAFGIGIPPVEMRYVVEPLVEQGWLRWEDPDKRVRVEWARPLARRVVAEILTPCRRDVMRRSLVTALSALPPGAAIVRLLLELDRVEDAADRALACVGQILADGHAVLAAELVDDVSRRLQALKVENPERFAPLWLEHVRCMLLVRPTDPAVARSLAKATELAQTDEQRALVNYHRSRLQSVIGHYPNYRKYLLEAWEHAGRSRDLRLQSTIASALGQVHAWAGQPRTASDWYGRARDLAQQVGQPAVAAYADAAAASFALARGDIGDAERAAATAIETFRTVGHLRGLYGALPTWGHALREQGRFSDALAVLQPRLPEVRQAESPSHYVSLLLVIARCEVDLFRLGRAQECVDELDATIRAGEHLHLRLEARLIRGRILLASGQYRDAASVLLEVHTRARAAELIGLAEHARALLAETHAALGDKESARELFQNATLGLLGTGEVVNLAEACAGMARALADERDPVAIFQPVKEFLDTQPAALLRMELLLGQARWYRSRGERIPAFHACREAATLLNRIGSQLNDTDRAALRVHPWSRAIRQGLK